MTTETCTIRRTRGYIYDVPPRPTILAQIEAATSGAMAIADAKARANQMVAERNAAINEGRVARAADHIEHVREMLIKRKGWMRISEIVAELKANHGADVHPVDLGKAMRRTPGFEWSERRGRVCWRVK